MRSFFWSVFSCIQSEYRKIRTREKNPVFEHFSRSGNCIMVSIEQNKTENDVAINKNNGLCGSFKPKIKIQLFK